jgi:hypothetical protein
LNLCVHLSWFNGHKNNIINIEGTTGTGTASGPGRGEGQGQRERERAAEEYAAAALSRVGILFPLSTNNSEWVLKDVYVNRHT